MKLFSILTAAACLLVVSACASTPAPTDERVHVMAADAETDVQPGNIYISADAAQIFTFRDVESEINENGYLAVRIFGKTPELSALKWAFFGDISYGFSYSFFWFDADGNPVSTEAEDCRSRIATPGDPVRFVGHAPTEECRNFAMVLYTASEQPGDDVAEPADAEATEDAGQAESDAAQREEERVKEVIPDLPEQNVSGDKQDVKVIGVSDKDAESVPKAVPTEKE